MAPKSTTFAPRTIRAEPADAVAIAPSVVAAAPAAPAVPVVRAVLPLASTAWTWSRPRVCLPVPAGRRRRRYRGRRRAARTGHGVTEFPRFCPRCTSEMTDREERYGDRPRCV